MSVAVHRPRLRADASAGGRRPMPAQIGKYRDPRPPRRWRDERGLPRLRRLPGPERRDQAGARRRPRPIPLDGHYSERFFAAEAALVGRLQHPNVVQIFDAVPDPVAPYLVMEYVAGSTLRPYCRADQLLSLELIVEIGFKCAMALGYVYRQGLIHRDVKPANLLDGADQRHRSPTSRSPTSAAC